MTILPSYVTPAQIDANGDWSETIALSREAWNSLKNHWMRCRIESWETFDG